MLYNKNGNVIKSDLNLDFPVLSADEVEQGYDGGLYLKGTAPQEPLEAKVARLEAETGLTRIMREGILAEGSPYSAYAKEKALEIEELAAELRTSETEEKESTTTVSKTETVEEGW